MDSLKSLVWDASDHIPFVPDARGKYILSTARGVEAQPQQLDQPEYAMYSSSWNIFLFSLLECAKQICRLSGDRTDLAWRITSLRDVLGNEIWTQAVSWTHERHGCKRRCVSSVHLWPYHLRCILTPSVKKDLKLVQGGFFLELLKDYFLV